jgi:hypothetical protein
MGIQVYGILCDGTNFSFYLFNSPVSRLAAPIKPTIQYGKFSLGVPSHRHHDSGAILSPNMSLPIFDYLSGLESDQDVAQHIFISNL